MILYNFFNRYLIITIIFILLFILYSGDTTICESYNKFPLREDFATDEDFETYRRLYEIDVFGRERNYFERNADTIIAILLVFTLFCTISGTYLDYIDSKGK